METKSCPSFYYRRGMEIVNTAKKNEQQTHDSKAQLNKTILTVGQTCRLP